MSQYLLSVYQPEGAPPPPERLAQIMRDVDAVNQEMVVAGVWVFSGGLHAPSTATVIRASEQGMPMMTDGPFAESKEYLGGLTIIEAADLDEALVWGRKVAAATTLPIEVRPFVGEPSD